MNIVQQYGLWSRPGYLLCRLPSDWSYGVLPNSPVQITSVSSSKPRAFRSVSKPVKGLSIPFALLRNHELILAW